MNNKKIKKKLKKIAERLYWGLQWLQWSEGDDPYVSGVIECASHIAACDIVKNVFPLMNVSEGLATCDVIDTMKLMEPETKSEVYDELYRLLELNGS
tara:strand:- start:281 stop:571 length:291 start_codon:yes stop_codon:yes gene_type:complete